MFHSRILEIPDIQPDERRQKVESDPSSKGPKGSTSPPMSPKGSTPSLGPTNNTFFVSPDKCITPDSEENSTQISNYLLLSVEQSGIRITVSILKWNQYIRIFFVAFLKGKLMYTKQFWSFLSYLFVLHEIPCTGCVCWKWAVDVSKKSCWRFHLQGFFGASCKTRERPPYWYKLGESVNIMLFFPLCCKHKNQCMFGDKTEVTYRQISSKWGGVLRW